MGESLTLGCWGRDSAEASPDEGQRDAGAGLLVLALMLVLVLVLARPGVARTQKSRGTASDNRCTASVRSRCPQYQLLLIGRRYGVILHQRVIVQGLR